MFPLTELMIHKIIYVSRMIRGGVRVMSSNSIYLQLFMATELHVTGKRCATNIYISRRLVTVILSSRLVETPNIELFTD